jgi:hypothetical protein
VFEGAQVFFDKFGKFFVKLWSGVARIFVSIINGLITGFESFINFFVNGFNEFVRGINVVRQALGNSPLTLAAQVSFGRVEMPSIPQLADGGIIKATPGGMLALIGEGGKDEAVIPLDRLPKGGNTYNITINANVADARLGEVVVNAIKRYERTSGPVFASA